MMHWQDYRREARALFAIAWPTVIAQVAQVGTGVVDTIMAGRYSAEDLAAVAIGYNIWLPLFLFGLGVMIATSVTVAQAFGAGDRQSIRDSLPQALWLALLLGAVTAPLCYNAEWLLQHLGLPDSARDKSVDYLQMVAWGLPAMAIFQALRCHNQGLGLMKPYAVASIIGFLANIPLNYVFMYGRWGAPELGATGCGLATAICMWLGVALIGGYSALVPAIREYLPPLRWVAPDRQRIGEIARLGLPIGLTFFMEIGVFSVVGLMISTLGIQAMGAHQIAINLWDLMYMPLASVGSAMATRIGHAIGSGKRDAVQLALRTGMAATSLVALSAMLLLLSIPGLLVSLYTDEPGIGAIAERLIRLAALFILIDSLQIAGSFCLRAFRDTRFPFLVTALCYWVVALPLAWWLGLGHPHTPAQGSAVIWGALITGICMATVMVLWRMRVTLRRPLPGEANPAGVRSPDSPDAA
ncbi:MATE family efflux transporter [Mangrovimicrobium sediminis]|uniref:Multidrug-efflux transporter n=1 Tax=Mangrovimicrobium sediminis TaxID=2562682 RepID=A0A4Z0LW45_9GAMM|nr:MATE family efflux transporter [Haliea sp. SAOS-164]TGD71542.1 MATE family efflux transporter [Haliea sp. SAOS-164]